MTGAADGASIPLRAGKMPISGKPEHFLPGLRLVSDEHQPGHLRRLDGDSHQRGE